jgi:hypothetical protein
MENQTISIYKQSYNNLIEDLKSIQREKSRLLDEVRILSDQEAKLKRAAEGLIPFITQESELDHFKPQSEDSRVSRWRTTSLNFLKSYPGKKFTTAEILEFIHPNSESMNKVERRKATINLSAALGKLVDEKQIREDREPEGKRGFQYFIEEKTSVSPAIISIISHKESGNNI